MEILTTLPHPSNPCSHVITQWDLMALGCIKGRSFSFTCSLNLPLSLCPRTCARHQWEVRHQWVWTGSRHVGPVTTLLTNPLALMLGVAGHTTHFPFWWVVSLESEVLPAICLCQPSPCLHFPSSSDILLWIVDTVWTFFLEGSSTVRQNREYNRKLEEVSCPSTPSISKSQFHPRGDSLQ